MSTEITEEKPRSIRERIILEALTMQETAMRDCLNDAGMVADWEKQFGADIETCLLVVSGIIRDVGGAPRQERASVRISINGFDILFSGKQDEIQSSFESLGCLIDKLSGTTETVSLAEPVLTKRIELPAPGLPAPGLKPGAKRGRKPKVVSDSGPSADAVATANSVFPLKDEADDAAVTWKTTESGTSTELPQVATSAIPVVAEELFDCLECLGSKPESEYDNGEGGQRKRICRECGSKPVPEWKVCSRCNDSKLLDKFAVQEKGKYGRASSCKDCQRYFAEVQSWPMLAGAIDVEALRSYSRSLPEDEEKPKPARRAPQSKNVNEGGFIWSKPTRCPKCSAHPIRVRRLAAADLKKDCWLHVRDGQQPCILKIAFYQIKDDPAYRPPEAA